MRALWSLATCLFAVAQPGCLGTSPGNCLYDGKVYHSGDSFPSSDGCNSCGCQPTGDVACTARACAGTDGGTGDTVMCTGAAPAFPTFDKRCAVASECSIALHQFNCCGSERAIGISQSERVRFDKDEAVCRAQYPGCGCATLPTVAEDGKTSMMSGDIVVNCSAGACTTAIR